MPCNYVGFCLPRPYMNKYGGLPAKLLRLRGQSTKVGWLSMGCNFFALPPYNSPYVGGGIGNSGTQAHSVGRGSSKFFPNVYVTNGEYAKKPL